MCFIINYIKPESKIADKDIICYKQVYPLKVTDGFNWFTYLINRYIVKSYKSEYTCYIYKSNVKEPIIKLELIESIYGETGTFSPIKMNSTKEIVYTYSIHEGYHSYKNVRRPYNKNLILVKCIIPKGTLYYENDICYVSETIIINKRYKTTSFTDFISKLKRINLNLSI